MLFEEVNSRLKELKLMLAFALAEVVHSFKHMIPTPEVLAESEILSEHLRTLGSEGVQKECGCSYIVEHVDKRLFTKLVIICRISLTTEL